MYTNFEKDCLEIYYKLVELGKEIYGGSDEQRSLIRECIDFERKWLINIGVEDIPFQGDLNRFESIRSKLLRKTKKCVILGNTSSGKSTLVNALLAQEILPTGFGSTSNCFFEITASPTNENYLLVNNKRRNIENLKELNDIKSRYHLPNGSLITMYYNKNECKLLKDDVVIIDTPGSNSIFMNDNSVGKYFKDADVVVLVVNAQSGITTSDEQFFLEFRTRYTNLHVIIVYNFWDFVNPNGDNIPLLEQCIINAKHILCDMLQIDDDEADKFIFFISASERIKFLTSDNAQNSGSSWIERNESFEQFCSYLDEKMSDSLFTKNHTYLTNLKSLVTSRFIACQNYVSQINNERFNLEQKITNKLVNIEGLYEKFKQIISEIFNKTFECLLFEGLKLSKTEEAQEAEKNKNPKNFKYETISLEDCNQKYLEMIEKIVKEHLENAKKELIDLIKKDEKDENILSFRQNIFNEIYFGRYFYLNNKLNSFDIKSFKEHLKKINRVIKIGSGITIGLCSALLAIFGAATGGAIPAVIAAEVAIIGGSAAVGAVGGGTSYGGITLVKLPFRFAWKEHEIAIKELWNVFELDLINNYSTLINDMISNVTEKANKNQNNLNDIEEKLQTLRN